jgi:hypothetical protein
MFSGIARVFVTVSCVIALVFQPASAGLDCALTPDHADCVGREMLVSPSGYVYGTCRDGWTLFDNRDNSELNPSCYAMVHTPRLMMRVPRLCLVLTPCPSGAGRRQPLVASICYQGLSIRWTRSRMPPLAAARTPTVQRVRVKQVKDGLGLMARRQATWCAPTHPPIGVRAPSSGALVSTSTPRMATLARALLPRDHRQLLDPPRPALVLST